MLSWELCSRYAGEGADLFLYLVLFGLIVGALGRLAIPGADPMSIPITILIGVGGSLIAGLITVALVGRTAGLLSSVLGATLLVYLYRRSRTR